jgi:hypothetical protein
MCCIQSETVAEDTIDAVESTMTVECSESFSMIGESAESVTIADGGISCTVEESTLLIEPGALTMTAGESTMSLEGEDMMVEAPIIDLN